MNQPSRARGTTAASVRWLLHSTRDLLTPLALASVLCALTRFAGLGIYYVAALGLLKALGLPAALPGSDLGFGLLGAWLIGLGLAKGGLRYAEQFVGHKVAFLALARLRNEIYADYERQAPMNAASQRSGVMLQAAVRDIDRIEVFFAHTLPPAFAAVVVSAGVVLGVGVGIGWLPALVLLVGYLILGLLLPAAGLGALRRSAQAQAAQRSAASQVIADTLSGAEVAFSLDAQRPLLARLAQSEKPTSRTGASAGWVSGARASAVALIPWLSAVALLLLSGPALPAGALIVLLVITVPSFEAVRAVEGFVGSLQESLDSARRLHANHLAGPPVAEAQHPVALPETGLGIQASGMSVQRGAHLVLKELDFTLEPGQKLALVGESGSGKSTLAAALLRAVPAEGSIKLGGVPLEQLALEQLRGQVALVAQNDALIRGTLRENLVLGRSGVQDEQLLAVCVELGLGDWLEAQSQGLETRLGERGSRVSGGQRQRLVVARALLREPQLLILDEATSALDGQNEKLVLAAVQRRVDAGMGLIMISHRLAILDDFQQVLVLQDGQLLEQGSAAALLAVPGSLFRQMRLREAEGISAGPWGTEAK